MESWGLKGEITRSETQSNQKDWDFQSMTKCLYVTWTAMGITGKTSFQLGNYCKIKSRLRKRYNLNKLSLSIEKLVVPKT